MTSLHQNDNADRKEVAALARSFEKIYARLRPKLEPDLDGQHVVIQVKTGEHFVARTRQQALAKAAKALGSTDYCWSRKIGAL